MPYLPFTTYDVFTRSRYAGNPLAIILIPPEASRNVPSTAAMQRIAREFNLSETIFIHENSEKQGVVADGVREWRVRIFLTHAEIPFAGHPTIGCAVYALSTLCPSPRGRFISNAGPIDLEYADGVAKASIPHDFHLHTEHPFTPEEVYALQPSLRLLGLEQSGINVVSPVKGMNFVCVELPSLAALGSVELSAKPAPRLDGEWDVGFSGSYFYALLPPPDPHVVAAAVDEESVQRLRARMIEGSLEDPATGSAACGLSCFLALREGGSGRRRMRFEIVQGVEMERDSVIGVVVDLNESGTQVEKVVLSGPAVKVMEGRIEVGNR